MSYAGEIDRLPDSQGVTSQLGLVGLAGRRMIDRPNGPEHCNAVAVMKNLHKLVAACLALCFALAGAVGLSPALHKWVEHGGQGVGHVHYVTSAEGRSIEVRHDATAPAPQLPIPRGHPAVTVRSSAAASPTGIFLSRFWQALNKGCADLKTESRAPSSAPQQPSHQHHSLPELLAGGLVDQAYEFPALAPPPETFASPITFVTQLAQAFAWDAQTAGRAPPIAQS